MLRMRLLQRGLALCSSSHSSITRRHLGNYARMLDLGGAPSSMNDAKSTRHLNLNKNCHLQVVLFDFDLLCRSVHASSEDDAQKVEESSSVSKHPVGGASIQPDISKIQQVASLLRVDLTGQKDKEKSFEDDDLSLLTGERPTKVAPMHPLQQKQSPPPDHDPNSSDIRHKYAAKLQKRTGGAATSSVSSSSSSTTDGDASFHLAARQAVVASGSSTSTTRWMAATGTGQLLQYLHSRSLQLVLYPTTTQSKERSEMQDFVAQMKDKVAFAHVLYPSSSEGDATTNDPSWTPERLMEWTTQHYGNNSNSLLDRCLWVSDRDAILRSARALGCLTLRVRPPNARRGNVSTHYTVASVPETMQVVNEINGISFNTVLSQRNSTQW